MELTRENAERWGMAAAEEERILFLSEDRSTFEQEEMRRIIGFLASQGAAGINRFNTSKDALLREVYSGNTSQECKRQKPDVYRYVNRNNS